MDFTPEILQFQGTIILANNLNPFSTVVYRGGNEYNISKIVNLLKNQLKLRNYLTQDGLAGEFADVLRYLNYYVVLNSDLPYLEELVNNPHLEHLIWTTPTITECLLCELIWGLNFEIFAGEIISYANPHLSLNLLKPLVSSVRYTTCQEYYKKVEILLHSAYKSLVRLHFYDCDETLLLSDYLDAFNQGLGYYLTPPSKCGVHRLNGDDLYKFYADVIKSLLRLLLKCFQMFLETPKFAVHETYNIYTCTLSDSIKNQETEFRVCDLKETSLLENICQINVLLMDTCMQHAMLISVDAFCCWSEYEDESGQTLQRSVGELAYQVRSHMNSHALLKHELANVLSAVACEPQSLTDAITAATNDCLIENGSKMHTEQTLWLQAIACKEELFDNKQLIECLLENFDKVQTEDSEVLLAKTLGYAKENAVNMSDDIKTLAMKSLIKSDRDKWNDLISKKHFTNNQFTNVFQLLDFEKNLTETFNKIQTTNVDIGKVYHLFIQNPKETYRKIFHVGIHDVGQTATMIDLLKYFKCFTGYRYPNDNLQTTLVMVNECFELEFARDVEKECFIKILEFICLNDIDVTNLVLFEIIVLKMEEYNSVKNYNKLELAASILKTLFNTGQYSARAPILCLLARLMDSLRWNPRTFTADRSRALSMAIDLQQQIIRTYNNNIPDKDAYWLKSNCKDIHNLNRFYYHSTLWNKDAIDFLQYTMGDNFNLDNFNDFLYFSRNLTSCTSKEWKLIASCLEDGKKGDYIDILLKALFIISIAVRDNSTSDTTACLKNCLRQFAGILQEACTAVDNDSGTIAKRLHLLLRLLATTLSQEDACDTAIMFLQTCSHISPSISRPLDDEIVEYLDVIGNSQLKQIFNEDVQTEIVIVNGA